jgi:16S rRNA pseudouridine516 synthase
MELERILRSQGFGSRPVCRALVLGGEVSVGGAACADPYAEFETEGLIFSVSGVEWAYRKLAYLMLNKPAGFECSHKPKYYPSVYSLLPAPLTTRGAQAVGRLDADTTGLLLFSDDGQFIHALTSPKKEVAKVYDIGLKHPADAAQIAALLDGVKLVDELVPVVARACELLGDCQLRMTVTEGKYHLVKRMIAAAGNRVESLHRIVVGDYHLPEDLPLGGWRWLDAWAGPKPRSEAPGATPG